MTLSEMRTIDIASAKADDLIDIQEVVIDRSLPVEQRIVKFIEQVKNPYAFKCGDMKVKVNFAANGPTLEECVVRILNNA